MKTVLLFLMLAVACASSATAQVRAASMPEWRGAILSSSQRLMLFSLLKTRPAGSLSTQKLIANRLGLFHRPGDGFVFGKPRLTLGPILEYDENVNGGVPGDSIVIDQQSFAVNKDTRAKAAFVIGAHTSATLSMAYDEGSTLDLRFSAALRHAPAVDVTRTAVRMSACANEYLSHWNWLVLCGGYKYDDARDTNDTEEGRFGSVGLRRVFASSFGSHEATATLTKDVLSDYDKLSVSASMLSAIQGVGALSLSATWGERVAGENTVTRSVSASLVRPILGQSSRVSLGFYESGGENFFGIERRDRTVSFSISREVREGLWIGIGARNRDSTADVYDENEMTIDASFTGWRF
ncbi:hypothetical protein [Falsirhodobacter sp. 20TX0035]|uniref:hypothetical protein n=1 Tax=Falsirhodobacter sp. 20TX0035 TaxID=3022019 RepID=UPI00233001B9|nr:hypothetical protein [Falsirhodobacter sp. 20TX0035]MDB6452591.1 hypothetical protein [Falsirhodobacter sp. 20TX0035]